MKPVFVYNFIKAVQLGLTLIFHIMFGRYFGVSIFADVYFISMVIISVLSTIPNFFTEYFMQYYNDIKVRDKNEAKKLYQATFNLSFLLGVGIVLIVLFFEETVIKIFASSLDAERQRVLQSFINIVIFSLLWTTPIAVNNSLLNAEMEFTVPYLVESLTPIFNIASLLLLVKGNGINVLAVSIFFSGLAGFSIQQIYILKKLRIPLGNIFWQKDCANLLRSSFSLTLGNQIWNLKDPITTNILSNFPAGIASTYFYAVKMISVLYMVTNYPVMQIFSSKVSKLVSERDFHKIRKLLRETVLMNTLLFIIILIPILIMLPKIIPFLFGNKISGQDIKSLHSVFLFLIPFYFIMSIETPFTRITIATKQIFTVLRIGVVFILIYGFSLLLLTKTIGIYAIPVALAVAQSQNMISYMVNAKKTLRKG